MAVVVNSCLNRQLLHRFYRRKHLVLTCVVLSSLAFVALVANQSSSSSKAHPNPNLRPDQRRHNTHPPPVRPAPPLADGAYIPGLRLVHIDLKGAPPKLDYFSRLFPLLAALGANALLVEYEDMFPFRGLLATARAHNAYTVDQIRALAKMAADSGLQVIPLIQTFGHLEFVLKLEPFGHLREVPHLPQALCPLKNGSMALIEAMVDQVLSLHPNARYLHIGCDEVFHIGLCDRCRQHERDQLFLSHVHRVAQYVVRKHAVIPIVWDDMLRQIPIQTIKESAIADIGVEPMIWTYIKDIYRFIPYSQFVAFGQLFPHVWTASAFKGAFGETLTVPNVRMHLDNNIGWTEVMREQHSNFRSIRGIAITGWQRYDHLAALCELLPAALPSLAINLLVVSGHTAAKDVFARFQRIMECNARADDDSSRREESWSVVDADPYLFERAANCRFAGSGVHRLMRTHAEVVKRVDEYVYDVTVHKAWMTSYNVRHNMSSPFRVDEGLQEYSSVYYGLQALFRSAKRALQEVYDPHTVAEWIEQNIYPSLLKMEKVMNDSMALKKATYWPRRPVAPPEDLRRRLATEDTGNNFNYH